MIAVENFSNQGEPTPLGEVLRDSSKSLLAEVKQGFQSVIDQITAPIDARLKNFDDKVSELVSDKMALQEGGFQLEELEKLRNNRMELTKVVEKLTAALKDLKEEKAVLERELKEAQEKQKEVSSAEVKMLNFEKAALRKDVMALAGEMRIESKLHAEKADVHRKLVKELEKEKRDLEARLETRRRQR